MRNSKKYTIDYVEVMDGTDLRNDNIDVLVRFGNGQCFAATFFTVVNIQTIMQRYSQSGECLNGMYFWCSNMVVVQNLENSTIASTISSLIASGEFESIFEVCKKDEILPD